VVALAEPRVTTIEGRRVLVVERTRVLPDQLAVLLNGGRDGTGRLWPPLRVAFRRRLTLGGARSECLSEDHRFTDWLEGFHNGSDGLVRYLHLDVCADCGAVCVRDASVDTLPGLPAARRAPRRKSNVIGWYSGARPGQRQYT
jgi:hypothetical protein